MLQKDPGRWKGVLPPDSKGSKHITLGLQMCQYLPVHDRSENTTRQCWSRSMWSKTGEICWTLWLCLNCFIVEDVFKSKALFHFPSHLISLNHPKDLFPFFVFLICPADWLVWPVSSVTQDMVLMRPRSQVLSLDRLTGVQSKFCSMSPWLLLCSWLAVLKECILLKRETE